MAEYLDLFAKIAYLISPVVLGGVSNMIFVKLPVARALSVPIDGGKILSDGKRLFGSNKTWKGFIGMVVLTAFWFAVIGMVTRSIGGRSPYAGNNMLLLSYLFNGCVLGLGYVLFELPNSYIKRRLNIPPGKNIQGMIGALFTLVDQSDSVIGCLLLMPLFYTPTLTEALLFFLVGTGIHYIVNILLYLVGLKKQAG